MPGGTGAMTIADGLRNVPRRRRSWKWFLHALVFLSLIGLQVHQAFERGPRDTVDAGWYIGYALSILHEQRLPPGTVDVVPLYPLWLTMWMRIDPGYRGYLQCLRFNLPYWSGEKVIRDGDTSLCRHLDNAGFLRTGASGSHRHRADMACGLACVRASDGRPPQRVLCSVRRAVARSGWECACPRESRHPPVRRRQRLPRVAGPVRNPEAGKAANRGRGGHVRPAAGRAGPRPPTLRIPAGGPSGRRDGPGCCGTARGAAQSPSSRPGSWSAHRWWVTPWLVRNYTEKGFVGFTEGYGPWIFMERLAYNNMAWRHWIAAFPSWGGQEGRRLASEWFGKDVVRWLHYGDPEARERRISGGGHLLTNVATGDQLGVVLERVWAELPRHLVVSVPLAWRGMDQTRNIPYGSVCWLLVILSFVLGSRRNRSVVQRQVVPLLKQRQEARDVFICESQASVSH